MTLRLNFDNLGGLRIFILYYTIATVTINLIVAVAIVLLNLHVAVSIGCRIPECPYLMNVPTYKNKKRVNSHELLATDKKSPKGFSFTSYIYLLT